MKNISVLESPFPNKMYNKNGANLRVNLKRKNLLIFLTTQAKIHVKSIYLTDSGPKVNKESLTHGLINVNS